MRIAPVVLCALVVTLFAGCKDRAVPVPDTSASAAPAALQEESGFLVAPPAGGVQITLTCLPEGEAVFRLRPWKVLKPQTGQITWELKGSVTRVAITPADEFRWPYTTTDTIWINRGSPMSGGPTRSDARGAYKYKVTGVCGLDGQDPDTIVVDPDLIWPS